MSRRTYEGRQRESELEADNARLRGKYNALKTYFLDVYRTVREGNRMLGAKDNDEYLRFHDVLKLTGLSDKDVDAMYDSILEEMIIMRTRSLLAQISIPREGGSRARESRRKKT